MNDRSRRRLTLRVLPARLSRPASILRATGALYDDRRRAIASRRGSCGWDVDHASSVLTLHSPQGQDFSGRTLEEGIAWCLMWLLAPGLEIGPFMA